MRTRGGGSRTCSAKNSPDTGTSGLTGRSGSGVETRVMAGASTASGSLKASLPFRPTDSGQAMAVDASQRVLEGAGVVCWVLGQRSSLTVC